MKIKLEENAFAVLARLDKNDLLVDFLICTRCHNVKEIYDELERMFHFGHMCDTIDCDGNTFLYSDAMEKMRRDFAHWSRWQDPTTTPRN